MHILDVLTERGLVDNMTSPELRNLLDRPVRLYCGFDPTADSLHLGNLVPIIVLSWFRRCGHVPVPLVGGATGRIGDPGGKTVERPLLTEEQLALNVAGIRRVLERLLFSGEEEISLLNNYEWYRDFSILDFLREVGRQFRVGTMLGKEMIRNRLQSEEGISYAEFSYQLLQAYDFCYLFEREGISLQIGGSDQWGNIVSGIELIRRKLGGTAHGLTFPLLVRSDGQKFGKSEKGAIWLSADKVSPYEFYQYLLRVSDADVSRLLRMLTFLPISHIEEKEECVRRGELPPQALQQFLATEVTRFIHGEEGVELARQVTEGLAPGKPTPLRGSVLALLADELSACRVSRAEVVGVSPLEIVVAAGLASSKGEVRRLIRNGGLYLNNEKVQTEETFLSEENLIEGRYLVFSVGKKQKAIVEVLDS